MGWVLNFDASGRSSWVAHTMSFSPTDPSINYEHENDTFKAVFFEYSGPVGVVDCGQSDSRNT